MRNEKIADLPDHLAPLLEPTPSGVAKLLAAWDDLTTESQMLILMQLDKAGLPGYLSKKVRINALDSANAYVRYLGARKLYFVPDDTEEAKAIKQRIEEDPSPLVRYCLLESEWAFLDPDLQDPDAFFALPHEARLAKIRLMRGSGETIANLIEHAVNHHLKEGKVSEIELFEILSDYVNKPEFKNFYDPDYVSYDGLSMHSLGKDIDALWRLVLKIPERISSILIENLPPHAGLSSGIPEEVLNGMNCSQLETLFYREDIHLKELRKKVFFEAGEEQDAVRSAATCYNFDFDYAEFAAILAKPESGGSKILRDLTSANELSLCIYEAIHDVLFEGDVMRFSDAEFALDAFKRRLEKLKGWEREKQLRELKLYRLAKQAVPWKQGEEDYPPEGELEFLSKAIVEGETWSTFMAFSKSWAKESQRTKKLEKCLPCVYEAGEDELDNDINVDDENAG